MMYPTYVPQIRPPRPASVPIKPTWSLAWGLFWRWLILAFLAYIVFGGITLVVLLMLGWTIESLI